MSDTTTRVDRGELLRSGKRARAQVPLKVVPIIRIISEGKAMSHRAAERMIADALRYATSSDVATSWHGVWR